MRMHIKREMRNNRRTTRIVPALGKVIDFTYKKKTLSGKVVKTCRSTDAFEVESNGSVFLVDEFMGKFIAGNVIKARKF